MGNITERFLLIRTAFPISIALDMLIEKFMGKLMSCDAFGRNKVMNILQAV